MTNRPSVGCLLSRATGQPHLSVRDPSKRKSASIIHYLGPSINCIGKDMERVGP